MAFTGAAADFKGWLTRQAAMVAGSAGLQFHCGAAYPLSDGTISVPVSIYRNGAGYPQTNFVFHYHPGASGPSVGHGYASEGHFKPFDGAPKYIRVEKHECTTEPLKALYRDAKALAR